MRAPAPLLTTFAFLALFAISGALPLTAATPQKEGASALSPAEQTSRATGIIESLILGVSPKERRRLLKQARTLKAVDLAQWRKIAEGPRQRSPRKPGTREEAWTLGKKKESFRVLIHVPKDYRPSRRYALWLTIHGTGGRAPGPLRAMKAALADRDFIVALLEEAPSRHGQGWGYRPIEREVHLEFLDRLLREYQIDRRRIYVNGWSRGGHASFDLAMRRPDLFAGAGPIIGSVRERDRVLLVNLGTTRLDILNGKLDQAALVRGAEHAAAQLKESGYEHRFRLDPTRGHGGFTPDDLVDMVEYLAATAKPLAPKTLALASYEEETRHHHWLQIEKFGRDLYTPGKPIPVKNASKMTIPQRRAAYAQHIREHTARVRARVEKENRIIVDAHRVTRLRIHLHEELVDFSSPVEIVVNGRRRAKKKIRPSLRHYLDTLGRRRNPWLAYPASIALSIR